MKIECTAEELRELIENKKEVQIIDIKKLAHKCTSSNKCTNPYED